MNKLRWDVESLEYFKNNYFSVNNNELATKLGRSVPSLIGMAQRLGLKKSHQFRRLSNCGVLLNRSYESLYWIGFIMADGNINKLGRLKVAVAEKDYDHLSKLSDYLQTGIKYYGYEHPYYEIQVMDKDVFPTLAEDFQIHYNKTYSPPNLRELGLADEDVLCLFIGFIDGDGSRQFKKPSINIKCHASWQDNLSFFSETLQRQSGITSSMMPRIIGTGHTKLSITNSKLVSFLEEFIKQRTLPVLERKWLSNTEFE